jgi:HlyD family secretion protein
MRNKWWLGLVLFIAVGSGVGWAHFRHTTASEYQTSRVALGDISSTVAATGTCNAVVTVQVGSQVSGNIKALYADFNTKVARNQLVALIDPEIFQAKVNQAQANLDNARESVINAQAAASKARADIASANAAQENAKAQQAKVQADLHNADLQLQRRLTLFSEGVMAKEDTDNAQAAYDGDLATVQAAQAQVIAAGDNVKSAQAQFEVATAQVEAMQAQVRQFQAALAEAALDLEHTQIRAPVDGTVIARYMDVGQTVAASFQAPTIFEIAQDLTKMQVDTNIDEADIGVVRVGQQASFTVDAFPGVTFRAEVSQIRKAPINVQNVITYDAVLTVDNKELKLFPGMTANVRILTNELKHTLKVPNAAFRFRLPGANENTARRQSAVQSVFILGPDKAPHPVQVTMGVTDGSFTAVSGDSLHEGDSVIVGIAGSGTGQGPSSRQRGPTF